MLRSFLEALKRFASLHRIIQRHNKDADSIHNNVKVFYSVTILADGGETKYNFCRSGSERVLSGTSMLFANGIRSPQLCSHPLQARVTVTLCIKNLPPPILKPACLTACKSQQEMESLHTSNKKPLPKWIFWAHLEAARGGAS